MKTHTLTNKTTEIEFLPALDGNYPIIEREEGVTVNMRVESARKTIWFWKELRFQGLKRITTRKLVVH